MSALLLTPELAVPALAVSAVMLPMLLTHPKLKSKVDEAIAWAIKSCVYSANLIAEKFKELGENLAGKIADLAKAYNIYTIKQKIPSELQTSDGKVDLSKFDTPSELNKGGKGRKPSKGPKGWEIRPVLGTSHKGDKWKLYYRDSRIASLKPNGEIVGK